MGADDLRVRQPDHSLPAVSAHRSDGVQGPPAGGGNGHHRPLGFHGGLGADHGDAAAAIIPALGVSSPQVSAAASLRRNPP